MKKLLALVLVFLSISISFSQAPANVFKAKESIFYLYKDEEFICTSFAISGSLLYTAGHCISDRKAVYTITQDREKFYAVQVLSVRYSQLTDIALLKTQDIQLKPLYQCKTFPNVGDTLWLWGSPLGFNFLLRTGIYSGELGYSSVFSSTFKNIYATTINADKGVSGAPVLTTEGCYVGLATNIFSTEFKLDGVLFRKVL